MNSGIQVSNIHVHCILLKTTFNFLKLLLITSTFKQDVQGILHFPKTQWWRVKITCSIGKIIGLQFNSC